MSRVSTTIIISFTNLPLACILCSSSEQSTSHSPTPMRPHGVVSLGSYGPPRILAVTWFHWESWDWWQLQGWCVVGWYESCLHSTSEAHETKRRQTRTQENLLRLFHQPALTFCSARMEPYLLMDRRFYVVEKFWCLWEYVLRFSNLDLHVLSL